MSATIWQVSSGGDWTGVAGRSHDECVTWCTSRDEADRLVESLVSVGFGREDLQVNERQITGEQSEQFARSLRARGYEAT